ncbi:uncharacterized protein TRAVEDRAFT_77243, partial [Trametes versicolor FP-101664 SS1]|uniref:uncharacterized protein n=1 Tax=Trametes versicolor (strain FP-101664) TaxID=717944 RepID=UPI00046230DB
RAYPCTMDGCGRRFARRYNLLEHVRSVHSAKLTERGAFVRAHRPHQCTVDHCSHSYARQRDLQAHMR